MTNLFVGNFDGDPVDDIAVHSLFSDDPDIKGYSYSPDATHDWQPLLITQASVAVVGRFTGQPADDMLAWDGRKLDVSHRGAPSFVNHSTQDMH